MQWSAQYQDVCTSAYTAAHISVILWHAEKAGALGVVRGLAKVLWNRRESSASQAKRK